MDRMILEDLLLESSSSDDDEEMYCSLITIKKKSVKLEDFVANVIDQYDDETFRQNLRLTRPSFEKLVTMFDESRFMPKYIKGRPNISAKRHMLIFLWFAGTKQVCRTVALQFDVTVSSFYRIISRVMMFLNDIAPQVIKLPSSPESKAEIAGSFEKISGFRNVLGCIDGCYINIQTPANKIKSTYVNRHHQTALTLQGVCDAEGKFIDVVTGFSSKLHDARIFKLSFLYPKLRTLCGPNNMYHLLGDSAYPISGCLLTPFRHNDNLTTVQRRFNKALCKTRVKIENAFGLLKGRFRQLIRLDFHSVERASYFIIACCVLHNLCKEWNEDEDFEITLDEQEIVEPNFNIQDKQIGEAKRNFICLNSQFH